ncbi:hypothetical protein Sipo8835_10765 [Streptomyces ipomoeae]|uniref:Uncharacterized protein n=1 Tax=Streptomyces ipomoeae TaxID=103232 RepID=A0AAE9B101_9ACTN|nr:hypothetical protein [Streptomyces ipomoeae]MDX2820869.1 hypothetical protein [Streptomyces ipomoeae]MDX2873308.1 hypothetical protein [Streptomyces ipomoeae]TQE36109.1 hypothetical protein Sipo8835_10765 [Streptomyces ipomoeae]
MDWLSPVSGLVGALVGAGLSYLATHSAQAKALADARQARLEAKQDQAVTTLATAFGDLHKHVRSVPDDREPGMSAEDAAMLTAARQAWDEKLQDHIAPARLAIGVIRDRQVRHRLNEAMTLLEVWDSGLVYAFHGRSRVWVLRGVISHAVDCVGAWQREEALPEPNRAFAQARESLAAKQDEWEAIAEAEEEDRRRRRAQREGNGS